MTSTTISKIPTWRRLPIGVEMRGDDEAHARVWAPRRKAVELVTYGDDDRVERVLPLDREDQGYFSGFVEDLHPGTRYRFRLDHGEAFPDPASRYQPDGPHGPSEIVDPTVFHWTDSRWPGIPLRGQIISEIHLGTFSAAGTFRGAIDNLDAMLDVGFTTIEIMPVADFGGRFGWGYDGVNPYAPTRLYGSPDDFRALVDAAHARGLAVILDVVYNHFGPDGNYLTQFAKQYFSGQPTEWGDALNFDGPRSAAVREFIVENAGYWISEFHLDGLRLDATQSIFDKSDRHVIADITSRARQAAGNRPIIIIAENERQDRRLLEEFGVDAVWNDDFHHSAFVAATGKHEAYYNGYRGTAQEFISAAKYGYLYQGQYYAWQRHRRGTPTLRFDPCRFINYIESHDQVANSLGSRRLHRLTSPATFRALTALVLLGPNTPMLFQGEEFSVTNGFPYFAGHSGELAQMVWKGRATFLTQFPSIAAIHSMDVVPDPARDETFEMAKLDWADRKSHQDVLAMHRDLIAIRKTDPVIRRQPAAADGGLDGAVIAERAFILRYFTQDGDRLLVVNLGDRLHADPIAEPLLAPPESMRWRTIWSSEDSQYGGAGRSELEAEHEGWWLPPHSTSLLAPELR
jgi:maltooligosyltrehalose trehalohydrolase